MHNYTIQLVLLAATQRLATVSTTPRLDAELLLAHALQFTRAQLYARTEQVLTSKEQQAFHSLLARREAGEPVAYITGYQEFWSLELAVTPATLIPRPETELLVGLVLEQLPTACLQRVADLGTGSGAIALAIASERSHWSIVATDDSTAALEVAQRNAQRLQLSHISFYQGSWCQPLQGQYFHAIVSNPPYIRAGDSHLLQPPGLQYEPMSALIAGRDGLLHLRTIIEQAKDYLLPAGWLLLEHGYDQAIMVKELLRASGYRTVASYPDLAGIDRVTLGQSA